MLVARRGELLEQLAQEIRHEFGREVRFASLDLASPQLADDLREHTAGIEIGLVVYNAAFSLIGPFAEQKLEAAPRKHPDAIYAGAIGYIGWNGNMDTAIAIRTAVIADGTLHIQAGAGIVADSVPSLEWKETMNKGRAIFKAVAAVAKGFDHGFDE